MAKLSITTAWNETAAFVKQEAGPLFLIAFGLMTLPSIILQVILPQLIPGFGEPGATPSEMFTGMVGLMLVLFIPVIVISLWGNLTITVLALRRETVIGHAFRVAATRLLPLIGASLIILIAAGLAMTPIVMIAAAAGGAAGTSAGAGSAALLLVVLMPVFVFVAVRLMLMTPAAAAESVGPIEIIKRSWRLTSGNFWKLFGFLILLIITLMVLMIAVGAVLGIAIAATAGAPEPGSLAALLALLVTGVIQAVFSMILAVAIARIYEQLAGGVASTAQVFE